MKPIKTPLGANLPIWQVKRSKGLPGRNPAALSTEPDEVAGLLLISYLPIQPQSEAEPYCGVTQ